MIQHAWSVLAERSLLDETTHNYSLIEVLEQLSLPEPPEEVELPVRIPFEGHLVSLWYRENPEEPERGESRLRVLGPDGESLHEHTREVDLSSHHRMRQRGRMSTVPVGGQGIHLWEVSIRKSSDQDWNVVTRIPLAIVFTTEEAASGVELSDQ